MLRKDFAIFIITHGRPKNDTYKQLMKRNCKYPIYMVIDDEDSKMNEYISLYGKDNVCIFNKEEYEKQMDMMDNFVFRKVGVYARNACFDFAKKLGYKYFIELDDDYTEFAFRFPGKKWVNIKDINEVFTLYVDYYASTPIKVLAFMQGGDSSAVFRGEVKRKAMNCLFCSTDRRLTFNGHMNDDVSAYTIGNFRGDIFISFPYVTIHQRPTQIASGAMNEIYNKLGTYTKTFYSVMQCPSCVKVGVLRSPSSVRVHHKVLHNYCNAKILSDKYKKK